MRYPQWLYLLAGLTFSLAGCQQSTITPEVNDANCQVEKIKKIEDEATRKTFGSLCSRRSTGPETLPSNPKKW